MSSSFLFLDYQKKLKSSIWYEKDNLRILYYVIVCSLTCCVDGQTKRNVSKGLYPVPQDCGESGPSSFQLKKSHQPQLQSAHLLSSERFNLKLDPFGVYKISFKDINSILSVFANQLHLKLSNINPHSFSNLNKHDQKSQLRMGVIGSINI